jgi:hypothetical protein
MSRGLSADLVLVGGDASRRARLASRAAGALEPWTPRGYARLVGDLNSG